MDAYAVNTDLRLKVTNKEILSLALPISIAILVPQINMLTNNIFLGMLGTEHLGNAGITGVFYLIFAVAGHGLNNAQQMVLSKYAGANDHSSFNSIMWQGVRFSAQIAAVFMLFTWFIAPFIMKAVADPASYPAEMNFLRIRIIGLPFLFLFQMCNAFFVASLNSRYLIYGFLAETGVNVLLDYVLIFGHFGFPKMGFNGAAVASVIAEFTGFAVAFGILIASGLKRKYNLFNRYSFHKKFTQQLRTVSVPLIFQYMISVTTWLVFFFLIEQHGEMAKAVSNAMRNVFGLSGIFVWAFASTANVTVGNLMGQQRYDLVIKAIWKISYWSIGFCLIMVALLNVFPGAFLSLFQQNNEFNATALPVIRIVSLGMILSSVAVVWLNSVTGTGKTKINLAIEIVAISLYLGYTWYFMKYKYINLAWAWSNELVYWSFVFALSAMFIYSKKWKP